MATAGAKQQEKIPLQLPSSKSKEADSTSTRIPHRSQQSQRSQRSQRTRTPARQTPGRGEKKKTIKLLAPVDDSSAVSLAATPSDSISPTPVEPMSLAELEAAAAATESATAWERQAAEEATALVTAEMMAAVVVDVEAEEAKDARIEELERENERLASLLQEQDARLVAKEKEILQLRAKLVDISTPSGTNAAPHA
jgi:hypothetical protein